MFAMFFVWFASSVAKISFVIGAITFGLLASFFIWFMITGMHNCELPPSMKDVYPFSKKGGKWLLSLGVASAFIWASIPSEKTVYMMGGAYIGQNMLQSETAAKVKKLFDVKLDQYLEEMETEIKKKANIEVTGDEKK